jgi:predicted enzyme related to lactoylglutathione lyase
MIKVTEVAFVGYPVTDVARARAFYEGTLGLKTAFESEFRPGQWWIEYDIAGVALAISNAWPPSGQSGPNLALEVSDLDASLAAVKAKGVPVSLDPMESPVCRFFGIKDPDGNDLTLHQRKPPQD